MGRTISFLHLDYSLSTKKDAELVRVVEPNGDVNILMPPPGWDGDFQADPEDTVISADDNTPKESKHAGIIRFSDR